MRSQCLFAASLPLSTSTLVCVVLLANRLSLVLPYFLFYHTLLLPADISSSCRPRCSGGACPRQGADYVKYARMCTLKSGAWQVNIRYSPDVSSLRVTVSYVQRIHLGHVNSSQLPQDALQSE